MGLFRQKKASLEKLPDSAVDYPAGSCVKTSGGVYYLRDKKRYKVITDRVLKSWAFPRVIITSEAALVNYKLAGKLGFRDGTLLHNIADGKLYLVVGNKRRHVTSPDALERIGATFNDAITVSTTELNLHQEGDELN